MSRQSMVLTAKCWAGPFCGRTHLAHSVTVYQGRNTGSISLGIRFLNGRTLGRYVPDPTNPQRLVWRPAR